LKIQHWKDEEREGRIIADLLAQIFDHADEDSIIKTYWTGKNVTGGASNS